MQNLRGLEHVADGTFGGQVNNLDGSVSGADRFSKAVTVINFTFKDNIPRPVTVTLFAPNEVTAFVQNIGFPSVYVQWGAGGSSSWVLLDGREGDQFTLTCSSLRVGIFNDSLAQAFGTLVLNGVTNPITFGAFASLGVGINRAGFLRRTKVSDTPQIVGAQQVFTVPKYATNAKFYRYPGTCDYKVQPYNPYGSAGNLISEFSVAANADCPVIELSGDTKAIEIENGAVPMTKSTMVWGMSL